VAAGEIRYCTRTGLLPPSGTMMARPALTFPLTSPRTTSHEPLLATSSLSRRRSSQSSRTRSSKGSRRNGTTRTLSSTSKSTTKTGWGRLQRTGRARLTGREVGAASTTRGSRALYGGAPWLREATAKTARPPRSPTQARSKVTEPAIFRRAAASPVKASAALPTPAMASRCSW